METFQLQTFQLETFFLTRKGNTNHKNQILDYCILDDLTWRIPMFPYAELYLSVNAISTTENDDDVFL